MRVLPAAGKNSLAQRLETGNSYPGNKIHPPASLINSLYLVDSICRNFWKCKSVSWYVVLWEVTHWTVWGVGFSLAISVKLQGNQWRALETVLIPSYFRKKPIDHIKNKTESQPLCCLVHLRQLLLQHCSLLPQSDSSVQRFVGYACENELIWVHRWDSLTHFWWEFWQVGKMHELANRG